MNFHRLALYALALLAAAGWGAAAWHSRQADRLTNADAVRVLSAAGWSEGRTNDRPDLDLPDGADHLMSGTVVVQYRDREVPVPGARTVVYKDRVLPTVCPENTWTLTEGDLGANVRLDISAVGDRPFGIVTGWVGARTPDGEVRRHLDPIKEPIDLDLWVSRDAVDQPRRFAFGLRRPRHWRTGWSVGFGLAYDPIDAEVAPVAAVTYGIQF